MDEQGLARHASLPRLRLIGGVNPVGGLLENLPDEFVGGLEDGGAQKWFQLGDMGAGWVLSVKSGDQSLDVGFLGEREVGAGRFFDAVAAFLAGSLGDIRQALGTRGCRALAWTASPIPSSPIVPRQLHQTKFPACYRLPAPSSLLLRKT